MNPFAPVVRRVAIPKKEAGKLFSVWSRAVGCANRVTYKGFSPGSVQLSNVRGDKPHGAPPEEWEITFEFAPNNWSPSLRGAQPRIDFEAELFGNWMNEDEADSPLIVEAAP